MRPRGSDAHDSRRARLHPGSTSGSRPDGAAAALRSRRIPSRIVSRRPLDRFQLSFRAHAARRGVHPVSLAYYPWLGVAHGSLHAARRGRRASRSACTTPATCWWARGSARLVAGCRSYIGRARCRGQPPSPASRPPPTASAAPAMAEGRLFYIGRRPSDVGKDQLLSYARAHLQEHHPIMFAHRYCNSTRDDGRREPGRG